MCWEGIVPVGVGACVFQRTTMSVIIQVLFILVLEMGSLIGLNLSNRLGWLTSGSTYLCPPSSGITSTSLWAQLFFNVDPKR